MRISLLFSYMLIAGIVYAQDSVVTKRVKVLPVPTFGYEPETKTYLGAVALVTLDLYQNKDTRTSNMSLEFTYTWKKQILFEGDWNYFFSNENWLTRGAFHFSKYPDLLYSLDEEISFDSDRYLGELSFYRKIKKQFFVGFIARHLLYQNITGIDTVMPDHDNDRVVGGGVSLLYDTRNNILTSTSGHYVDVSFQLNKSRANWYQKIIIDLRKYYSFSNKNVISFRFYNQFNSNRPPFFDEAYVGGDRFVRGFFYGRYRDRCMSALQVEYRLPVFWRIGLAAFGGFSDVYGKLRAFSFSDFKYNLGGGLRILVDKKEQTNLRLDFAIGQGGSSGFYFAFGESF